MADTQKDPRPVRAVNQLRAGRRDEAIALLQAELAEGPDRGERYRSIAMLAGRIGEVSMMLEASERYARTQPEDLARLLAHWADLASFGRADKAVAAAQDWEGRNGSNAWLDHAIGTMLSTAGDFEEAGARFRSALRDGGDPAQNGFALAMITRFTDHSEIDELGRLQGRVPTGNTEGRARLHYALGKAWHDIGEFDRAWNEYQAGAALRAALEPYSPQGIETLITKLKAEFDGQAETALLPPRHTATGVAMVNGLPRSGSTLVEQILTSHSQVSDGGETNLFRAASLGTIDHSLGGAIAFQNRFEPASDPWGQVAQTYARIMRERFPRPGKLIDKTLLQSHLMGLILHTLPDVPIVWMRRGAADNALSCFRTYFTSRMAWSWDPEAVAHFMACEDDLFQHWTALAGDRILVVPYEELVAAPQSWIEKIARHSGLAFEPGMLESHRKRRSISTASVSQVRQPINREGIGVYRNYPEFADRFEDSYRR